jgi:hypothetical protein
MNLDFENTKFTVIDFFSAKLLWTLKYRLFSFEGTIIGHYATT